MVSLVCHAVKRETVESWIFYIRCPFPQSVRVILIRIVGVVWCVFIISLLMIRLVVIRIFILTFVSVSPAVISVVFTVFFILVV